jgi:hypothetical protein
MTRYGAYANRNRAHRDAQAARLDTAAAKGSWAELAASFDIFRAAVRKLAKRRPPLGTPPGVHEDQADQLARMAANYLARLAQRVDDGEFDAKKAVA